MSGRLFFLATLCFSTACASSEFDTGAEQDVASELGDGIRDTPLEADLFVDVTDADGAPVVVERVTIVMDGGEVVEATCLDDASPCETWIAPFSARERVTAWAEICGHRFGDPLRIPLESEFRSDPTALHLSVVAVADVCPPRRG